MRYLPFDLCINMCYRILEAYQSTSIGSTYVEAPLWLLHEKIEGTYKLKPLSLSYCSIVIVYGLKIESDLES